MKALSVELGEGTMKNQNKPVTIFDVAEISGFSISTISRAINSPEKVNNDTRQKIFKVIDELEFVPKAEARARARRLNGRIGVITTYFYSPSFVQRLRGIADALAKDNFEMVIYHVDSEDRMQGYLSSLPLMGSLDGLVIITHPIKDVDAKRLVDHKLPTVTIEFPHPLLNSVEIDDVSGGKMATNYLIKKGHKKIAFLGDTDQNDSPIPTVLIRLKGFYEALDDNNIKVPKEYVQFAPHTEVKANQVIKELIQLPDPPTAIFAGTDMAALRVCKVSRQIGIKIPEELAVIGFDDLDLAEYEDLTTVRQHLDDSGVIAVEVLKSQISDYSRPVQHVNLPLEIIERRTA